MDTTYNVLWVNYLATKHSKDILLFSGVVASPSGSADNQQQQQVETVAADLPEAAAVTPTAPSPDAE